MGLGMAESGAMGVFSRRMALIRSLLLLCWAAALMPAETRAGAPATPAEAIGALGFSRADVGYVLFDVQTRRVLAEHNADQLFLPASVAKLATVFAALETLGPEFRFSTSLYRRGTDVYLKGGGDPVLASTDLQTLAGKLKAAAPGRFFYDDSLMVSIPEISQRQPLAAPYNTGLSALDVDFNRVEVDWSTESDGSRSFRALCLADGLTLPADWIEFAPATVDVPAEMPFLYAGDRNLDRWHYSPHLPARGFSFLPVKATSPHAAMLFRTLAKAAGVALAPPEPGKVPPDAVPIGAVDSAPLREIAAGLLRYSNNPSAELVGLAATRRLTGRSLSLADSAGAIATWLKNRLPRVDWSGFHLENHSGLSPDSRVSPRQMARLLTAIAENPALVEAMPALSDEGRALSAGENARSLVGKSGTMDYARGLAGFFLGKDGRPLGFSIFIFDRARRAVLDAGMDPRVLEPSPAAQAWMRRALKLDQTLLEGWMASY
jgi:D-alanyl-D-alanine carboxypeptidase/D-alanyl-D-alanine-endopeptidase (penicillin-binding protein 4)